MTRDRTTEVRQALARTALFGTLSEAQVCGVVARGVTQTFPARRVIFQKNDPGDSLMVVLSGRIKISNVSLEGREAVLNFMTPGQVLGEIALLDGRPRTADATAVEKSEVFVLRRRDVEPLLREQPDIAIRFIDVLCAKLRDTTEMVEDTLFLHMAARVAKALLRLAETHGEPVAPGSPAVRLGVKFSQRELGGYVGLARENVNRQLGAWREEGLVRIDRGHIVLLDPDGLRTVAEEAE